MSLLGSRFPNSYRDPLYAELARAAEQKYGLPTGLLDAIRTRGERSNADQVSSAGARGPYQFIPSTRQGFMRVYGIDPWSDPTAQTDAAAIHLRDDYKRTGSWDEATARYHGGIHPPAASYKYASRVGTFDNPDTSKPYYPGANEMQIGRSLYPVGMEASGVDPLAPEAPKMPAPIPGDPGISANVAAASPVASKKRGGILGALESIFMPDPSSRWAGALRDGLFNAKESQANYIAQSQKQQLDTVMAGVKLRDLLTKGEYQVVGNNVFHKRPDGTTEMITPPQQPGDKERLLQRWETLPDGHPAKAMIERMLLAGNADEVLRSKADTARTVAATRSGATVKAAGIRAKSSASKSSLPPVPQGWSVVK